MTPEELIEKMAKQAYLFEYSPIIRAEIMLRVVLQAIEDGECIGAVRFDDYGNITNIEWKPSFAKFMKGE